MIDIQGVFKGRRTDAKRLSASGFVRTDSGYVKDIPILDGQFVARITISESFEASLRVYDAQTGEEYVPARNPYATGAFVGEIHAVCEIALREIADACFYVERFQNEQTKRALAYIKDKYGSEPEFLWEKFPEFAAIRTPKKTWFGLVIRIEKRKLGIDEDGICEAINLKASPADVSARIAEGRAYPAYHMNKKCWFLTPLDDSLSDEELFALIDESHSLIK